MYALERLAAEELAGAVGVAHPQAEEDAQAGPVAARVGEAHGRVRPPQTVAGHDVGGGPSALPQRQQERHVGDAELSIAVGETDEGIAGGGEARPDGRAVAEVGRVMHDAHDIGVRGREPVRDLRGAIEAAVVDADDLESLGQRRQLSSASATSASMFSASLWAGKK